MIDDIDKKILIIIQKNSGLPLSEISKRVGISPTPCWNRIKKMEEGGVISARTIVLNRKAINLSVVVFLSIRVSHHSGDWISSFQEMIEKYEELKLLDYGFAYHKDENFPQDDISWFLLRKGKE